MKHTRSYLFLSCLLAIGFACNKKEQLVGDKIMLLTYPQTQCADPWGNNPSSDSLTIRSLLHYLDSAGLGGPMLVAMLKKEPTAAVICDACICPTGKIFYVSVMESAALKQKYLQAGFSLKE